MPVVVDPDRWATDRPVLARPRPVVVHAPSSGPMKGSDAIDPVMVALHDEGLIEYRRVHGVASADMPELYRDADIVLEQFRIGGYGVAACEAMAAGRVVIGHVAPPAREVASEAAGIALPIVESTAGELERVVRDVVRDPDPFVALAATGPRFVRTLHDGAASADALTGFLDS
jgi:glycosyltransferase involved in cell wall biosynthesis